jgi:hypothetical protein
MPTTIPARKNVEATMMITMDKRTVGWWAKIAFTGRAKSESSRQTSTGSEDVGVDAPIENFVLNAITDNLIDTKGYKVETLSDPAEFWGNDYKFYTGDGKVAYMEVKGTLTVDNFASATVRAREVNSDGVAIESDLSFPEVVYLERAPDSPGRLVSLGEKITNSKSPERETDQNRGRSSIRDDR